VKVPSHEEAIRQARLDRRQMSFFGTPHEEEVREAVKKKRSSKTKSPAINRSGPPG
jgi:hypothetical protein